MPRLERSSTWLPSFFSTVLQQSMTARTKGSDGSKARPKDSASGSPGKNFPFCMWWPLRETAVLTWNVDLGPSLSGLWGLRMLRKKFKLDLR